MQLAFALAEPHVEHVVQAHVDEARADFAGQRAREKGLPAAGRAVQHQAAGDALAELLDQRGIAQRQEKRAGEPLLRFVHAGDGSERDGRGRGRFVVLDEPQRRLFVFGRDGPLLRWRRRIQGRWLVLRSAVRSRWNGAREAVQRLAMRRIDPERRLEFRGGSALVTQLEQPIAQRAAQLGIVFQSQRRPQRLDHRVAHAPNLPAARLRSETHAACTAERRGPQAARILHPADRKRAHTGSIRALRGRARSRRVASRSNRDRAAANTSDKRAPPRWTATDCASREACMGRTHLGRKLAVLFVCAGCAQPLPPALSTGAEALQSCPPPRDPAWDSLREFDLASPPPSCRRLFATDGNGYDRNPFWGPQLWATPRLPSSKPGAACDRFASTTTLGHGNGDIDPRLLSACVSDPAGVWTENANLCKYFDYWKNPIADSNGDLWPDRLNNLYFRGHLNFRPATYDGYLHWDSHDTQFDRDFSFLLDPTDPLDPTHAQGAPGLVASGDEEDRIGVEFHGDSNAIGGHANGDQLLSDKGLLDRYSKEIPSDQAADDWWMRLQAIVHADDAHDSTYRATRAFLETVAADRDGVPVQGERMRAVVTGLMGLDCGHTCSIELHPAYAIALRTKVSVETAAGRVHEDWALFVRNWGDEGYCSSGHLWPLPLPQDAFTLLLPQPGAVAVTAGAVRLTAGAGADAKPSPLAWSLSLEQGRGGALRFQLPAPAAEGFVMGELHLDWELGDAPPGPGPGTDAGVAGCPAGFHREGGYCVPDPGSGGCATALPGGWALVLAAFVWRRRR